MEEVIIFTIFDCLIRIHRSGDVVQIFTGHFDRMTD